MLIGVLEWASCGGAIDLAVLPESIRREGWAMCRALIESVSMGGHEPVACLLPDLLRKASWPGMQVIDTARPIRTQWRDSYSSCDLVIVVAPESDDVLLELEAWCESNSLRTTNSDADFIHHASDKRLTAEYLRQAGIAHPWTCLLSDWQVECAQRTGTGRWVVKARDGAGCDGMQCVTTAELKQVQSACAMGDSWLVQPWISGQAFSRSAIIDMQGNYHWLPVVRQQLSVDRTVSYQGGSIRLDDRLTKSQAVNLQKAVSALPGQPKGWIGIDFLLGDDGQLTVIEINPRLTTSFVGLSQACDVSLADLIARAVLGQAIHLPKHWWAHNFSS